jgi:peptidoglycan/LPS O-acetylase OafA/YrhL
MSAVLERAAAGRTERSAFAYQPALDGLRAIAVLAVVVYHARPVEQNVLHGGFLGVDVFFVLSGYLITALLLREREGSGSISLRRFWARRARRLLPAVFVFLTMVAVYAASVAQARDLQALRDQTWYTLLYVQNWMLAIGDTPVRTVVAHTWSLSVEEQWYLLWPAAVLLITRLTGGRARSARVPVILVAGALASAVWSAHLYDGGRIARVYFGTDVRAQELLAGAALAFLLARRGMQLHGRARRALDVGALVGAATLVVGFASASTTDWSLYHGGMLVVSLATVLVIAAAVQPDGLVRRVLSNRALVTIGLLSYGIYLYHVPLFAFIEPGDALDGVPLFLVRLVVVVAFAWLSWRFVERPVRRGAVPPRLLVLATPVALAALIVGVLWSTGDVPARAALPPPATTAPVPREVYRQLAATTPPAAQRVLVVGDAFTAALGPGDRAAIDADGVRGVPLGLGGCGISTDPVAVRDFVGRSPRSCAEQLRRFSAAVEAYRPAVVVVLMGEGVDLYDRMVDGTRLRPGTRAWSAHLAARLAALDHVVTADGARMVLATAPCLSPATSPDFAEFAQVLRSPERLTALNSTLRDFARTHRNVGLVEYGAWLCGPEGRTVLGSPTRPDGVHLSPVGVAATWQWLARAVTASG